jgi:hypothetical protein
MALIDIPCILMRGGTSRGPYFNAADLPADRAAIAKVLIAVIGAHSDLHVDGIGGAQPTTSKVAILSRSNHDWADIDYLFAQVHAQKPEVDFAPSCGNIIAGVGPAALEMGLIDVQGDTTRVKIHCVNSGTLVEAIVETPERKVNYCGNARIDGVPGSAAPIILNFMDVIGSSTGKLFPTGNPVDIIDGIALTCIDAALPMVLGLATDFGISGYETRKQLDANRALFKKIERLRILAANLMGLGDVSQSVVPKFALLAAPKNGGSIAARYFTPWSAHPTFAVTGSICVATSLLTPGTIAHGIGQYASNNPVNIQLEHPAGVIDVLFDYAIENGTFQLNSAGLLRTARRLFRGEVSIPEC